MNAGRFANNDRCHGQSRYFGKNKTRFQVIMAAVVANLSLVVGFLSPQAEARRERDRFTPTSSLDAGIRRAKRPYCGLLDFLDSRSLFFTARHCVWFSWRCRGCLNQFQICFEFLSPETGVSGRISRTTICGMAERTESPVLTI